MGEKVGGAGRGAAGGALAGTAIAPGLGTAIGAGAGGLLGFLSAGGNKFDPTPYTTGIFAQEPTYTSGYNPTTDATAPGVAEQLQGIQQDPRALEMLRQEAYRQGPSQFSQLLLSQLPQQTALQQGQLQQGALAGQAQAQGQLAAQGGLTGGARERLAQGAQQSLFQGIQQAQGQAQAQTGQTLLEDERARQAGLQAQFGNEQQALEPAFKKLGIGLGAKQFDVQQAAAENARRSAFDLARFQAKQQQAGALAQAQATSDAGKK